MSRSSCAVRPGGFAYGDVLQGRAIVNFLMMSGSFWEEVGVERRQRSCSIVISVWLCFRKVSWRTMLSWSFLPMSIAFVGSCVAGAANEAAL